jgi:hypothetical protein
MELRMYINVAKVREPKPTTLLPKDLIYEAEKKNQKSCSTRKEKKERQYYPRGICKSWV